MYIRNILDRNKDEGRKQRKGNLETDRTPGNKTKIYLWVGFFIVLLFVAYLFLYYTEILNVEKCCFDGSKFKKIDARIFSTLLGLFIGILTFCSNEARKAGLKGEEETNKKKLYISEFNDLIRHIRANLEILLEMQKKIKDDKKYKSKIPESIHFTNLAWPENSILRSDEITKIVKTSYVDDFARIKVNLRNMHNSSVWLASYMKEEHSEDEIKEVLEWEIARQFNYLLTFSYLQANNYQYYNDTEKEEKLNEFIKQEFKKDGSAMKQWVEKEYMLYPDAVKEFFIDKYGIKIEDRERIKVPRRVLFRARKISLTKRTRPSGKLHE